MSQALGLEMDAISSAVIGGTLLTGGVGNVLPIGFPEDSTVIDME